MSVTAPQVPTNTLLLAYGIALRRLLTGSLALGLPTVGCANGEAAGDTRGSTAQPHTPWVPDGAVADASSGTDEEDPRPIGDPLETDASAPRGPVDAGLHCGDGTWALEEACDDGNGVAGDGCSAGCEVEPGYVCPLAGRPCRARACGDGVIAADEECEDGGDVAGDGCDARCRLEGGFACDVIGAPCQETVCGDGVREGSEACDDGPSDLPFDGCFRCVAEPECGDGGCRARCGDGIRFPEEACDDGNLRDHDGCSATCALEAGYACSEVEEAPPDAIELPVVVRDLRANGMAAVPQAGIAVGHPDFENPVGEERGIVESVLGADDKPVYAKVDGTSSTTRSADLFRKWYNDEPAYNRTLVERVRLSRNATGDYVFLDKTFFPADGGGFVAEGNEPTRGGDADEQGVSQHNFHFTSELRTQFEYRGGEHLEFQGDDDVWVFINRRLAVDLGGVHWAQTGSVTLDPSGSDPRFGLARGRIYEIAVFQAERHTPASTYQLTLRDFARARTHCESVCGDGILTGDEQCDDAANGGGYGECAAGCLLGPHCGDGIVQPEGGEECDDQNRDDQDSCSNTCKNNVVQ